ncbi:MAG: nucleotide exchange factor GrpE [Pseudomonadota bacterium]
MSDKPQHESDAEPNAPEQATPNLHPSVEELVPGLEEAIAGQDEALTDHGAQIAELTVERDQLKDKMMRALAEAENVRRRAERDKKDAEAYGGTRLARDLLAVYDNLARAMDAADDTLRKDHAAFLEGVELTLRELTNAFAKHKIAPVTPAPGDRFDPNRHQAMFEAPIPGAETGTIIEVMQAGFTISERLLRPALVGVAKAAPEAPAPDPAAPQDETVAPEAGGEPGDPHRAA